MAITPRQRVIRVHDRLARAGVDMPVRLWDGTQLGPDDAGFRLVLPQPSSLRAMLVPPTDLAVGEAFLAGHFHVEGSMVATAETVANLREDLSLGVLAGVARDVVALPSPSRSAARRRAELVGRRHSRARDRAAIVHHYDVGAEFYRLFLDEEMVYSCAYFLEGDEDASQPPDPAGTALDRAQVRKLDVVCRKLGLRPGMRLLDIGCGWGALVLHAARNYGVEALGVTLSQDQYEVAQARVMAAGLGGRVEIQRRDYRDVQGTFDAVSSVGMVEHVGAERLDEYAAAAWERTAPGGRLLNHGITTGQRRDVLDMALRRRRSFVGKHVFPDGALVPASHMVGVLQDAGWEVLDLEQLRPDYARTLQHWVARLEASEDAARELVDEAVVRTWRAYMAVSAVGFASGDMGVVQVLCGRDARRPLGRRWMLATDDTEVAGNHGDMSTARRPGRAARVDAG